MFRRKLASWVGWLCRVAQRAGGRARVTVLTPVSLLVPGSSFLDHHIILASSVVVVVVRSLPQPLGGLPLYNVKHAECSGGQAA